MTKPRTRRKIPTEFVLRTPELSAQKVWVGFYSEMTGTVAMMFAGKPTKCPILKDYNPDDPKYLGSIWVDEWLHWFGTVQPFVDMGLLEYRGDRIGYVVTDPTLDCRKVVQVTISMPWNEHGLPIGLNVQADN